jgi:fructose-1-phosphate kinase PfkB-like protein
VLIGSLPEGTPSDYYRRLLEATPCPAVLDARGPELLSALAVRPFCVKPNREELARTVGRSLDSPAELHAAMRELNERGAEWVVVTDGPHFVWASNSERLLKVEPPSVSVVNPIASGDCLAAGLAWGIAEGLNVADALRRGVAAASENCRTLLPGRLDRQRVLGAAEGIVVETM